MTKLFFTIGIIFIIIGLISFILNYFGINLGKLPGDISYKTKNFSFYFPIVSSIIISILLTIIINLIIIFFKK